MNFINRKAPQKSFTILELLIVIAIMAILGTAGVSVYRNYVKSVELESTAKVIISDLKSIRSKAMTGEDNLKWGIRFINSTNDYYELFSTPTDYGGASVKTSTFLPKAVAFSTPGEGTNLDIIFSKISGTTNSTSVIISSEGKTRTINVTSQGNIF